MMLAFLLYLISAYQGISPTCRADVDFNRVVNHADAALVSHYVGVSSYPKWLNQDSDSVISILDVAAVASKIGKTCG